mgnify:CR=1
MVLNVNTIAGQIKERKLMFVNPQINVVSSSKKLGIVELNTLLDSFCY